MAEEQPRQDKRAAVVMNPMKVPEDAFKANFFQLCADAGWAEPLWLETSEDDPGSGQARAALEAKVDVVMAAGATAPSVVSQKYSPAPIWRWVWRRWEPATCWPATSAST